MEGSADVSTSTPTTEVQSEVKSEATEETGKGTKAVREPGTDGKAPEGTPEKRSLKWRAKVDGSEEDVELDEETIKREYQKWKASDKNFREAAKMRKEAEDRLSQYKKDRWKLFKDDGLDPYQEAENLLIDKIKMEQMSPAERRAYELEQENAQYKARLEAAEFEKRQHAEALAKQEREAIELQHGAQLGNEIVDAIKATGLKPSPRLVARAAEHMLAKYSSTGEKLAAKDALRYAQKSLADDAANYLAMMDPAEAKKILPKSFMDGFRKSDVEEALAQDPVARTRSETPRQVRKELKRGTTDQIFDNLFEKKFKS